MDSKMKFFLSVVALPLSVLTFGLILAVGSIGSEVFGFGILSLLMTSFFVVTILSIRVSYFFYNKLTVQNVEQGRSLLEKTGLISNQKKWIESLESDISCLQEKLAESEKRHTILTDPVYLASISSRPAFVLDSAERIGFVNERFEKLSGQTLKAILGKRFEEVLCGPETTRESRQQLKSGLAEGRSFEQEILNYRNSGTSFTALISFEPVKTENGRMHLAFIEDVSEIREITEKLRVYEQMADNLEEVVFVTDGEGAIEWVNKSFERVTGYTSEEVIGRKAESFLRSKIRKPENGADDYSLTEAVYNYTKKGRGYWSSLSISPIYNGLGEVEKFIAIESEINVQEEKVKEVEDRIQELWEDQYAKSVELEKREEELAEALELCQRIKNDVQDLWLMSDQLESAVIITDKNGSVEWVNEGFEKVFGCKFSEVAGKKPRFMFKASVAG